MMQQTKNMTPSRNVQIFVSVVVVLSVLASGYFTVMGLVSPGGLVPGGDTAAAATYAAYMSVRSIVLLGASAWLLAIRAWRPLGIVIALNGAIQLGDAAIGVVKHQAPQTIGPICFAVALLLAARLLGGLGTMSVRRRD